MPNPIPAHRYYPYLTSPQIQAMPNRENVVIIQPLGAIEQHGPHLPLVVDAAIAEGILGRALTQLPASVPAYSLPPWSYGKSNEHQNFAGTISLSAHTLGLVLTEVAESIYRSGFRKLVFLNAHGGQPQVLEIVARDLHVKYPDFMVFPLFVWNVPNRAAELLTAQELAMGIHGGDAETSLMLVLLPELVQMALAVREYPPNLPSPSLLSLEGKLPFAWVTSDISKSGVIGDGAIATVEKGNLLLDSLVQGWVEVIKDIYNFQQPQTC